MQIMEKYPDGRQTALLSDNRIVLLSPLDSHGDRTVEDVLGHEIGVLQRLSRGNHKVTLLLTENTPEGTIKISLEEIEEESADSLVDLKQEYSWVFEDSEGGPLMHRLFELKADPELLRTLFDTIGSRRGQDRDNRWAVLRRVIKLVDNPGLRATPNHLNFWVERALPILQALHIELKS